MSWDDQATRRTRRPRRIEEVESAEVGLPIAWILIGALTALLVLGLVGLGAVNLLRQQAITPTPPVIPGLAPTLPPVVGNETPDAQATPTIPPVVTLPPTATSVPTETPVPIRPDQLEPGVFAKIINTDGFGASVRAGPGTNNARLTVVPEGVVVGIKDGPRTDENLEDYIWWYIITPDGEEGWVVIDFLEPSLPPGQE